MDSSFGSFAVFLIHYRSLLVPFAWCNVPDSKIRVKLSVSSTGARILSQHLIDNLIVTARAALKLKAAWAGGRTAPLGQPTIDWAISGLKIRVDDETWTGASGLMRFEEVDAAYVGVEQCMNKVNNMESFISIYRKRLLMPDIHIGGGWIIKTDRPIPSKIVA